MTKRSIFPLLISIILWSACADLKGVNQFSLQGARVMHQPFPYGYSEFCQDSCYTFDDAAKIHTPAECHCEHSVIYDTLITREGSKLSAYFIALAKLSGSEEIINIDTLGGAVAAGQYGQLNITATDVQVAGAVSTALQDLITVQFKSSHITNNLNLYGHAVDSAIQSYIQHLTDMNALTTNLRLRLELLMTQYMATSPPGNNRWAVIYSYNSALKQLEGRSGRFEKLIKQLTIVRKGYQQLVKNAEQIKDKTLKQKLLSLVNDISFISNN